LPSDRSETNSDRPAVLRRAVEVWGEDLQVDIAIEELSELTTELARRQRGRESPVDIREEIADVQLCLDQLKLLYGRDAVAVVEQDKLERLDRRVLADSSQHDEHLIQNQEAEQ